MSLKVYHRQVLLLLLLYCLQQCSLAFAPTEFRPIGIQPVENVKYNVPPTLSKRAPEISKRTTTSLDLFPTSLSAVTPLARTTALVAAATALILNLRRFLWPGAARDPSFIEKLPPGSYGCPWIGRLYLFGSKQWGPSDFWVKTNEKMGGLKLWKFYFLAKPYAVITGGKRIKDLLNQEFQKEDGVRSATSAGKGSDVTLGKHHLLVEHDGVLHSFYRRLVGQAMTPSACKAATPNIQELAEKQAQKIIESEGSVKMADVCKDFTLDVAWKQILGLDLDEDEVEEFYEMVDKWVAGLIDPRVLLNIFPKKTKGYKARMGLEKKIGEKIDKLLANGPDSTTISGLVFATDEEDSSKKLSREQIIDNILLLILAGSETSSSTLGIIMLCLGLHRDSWDKVVAEQKAMRDKYGESLDRDVLENECPYLDAVIKEAMRMAPIASGGARQLETTRVVDVYQLPKNWHVYWSIFLTHWQDPVSYQEDGSHMDIQKGYKPERWLNEATCPSTDFIPMGAGPRFCLGSNLAFTEMKVFLAVLARRIDYQLENPNKEIELKTISIMPQPADGVPIKAFATSA